MTINMTIEEDPTFSISFEYYGVPPPTFTWYINDEFYETVDYTESHGTHTMVFSNASQEGWYQCVVKNEFGSDNYSSFVEIVGNTLCDCTIIQYCVYMLIIYK